MANFCGNTIELFPKKKGIEIINELFSEYECDFEKILEIPSCFKDDYSTSKIIRNYRCFMFEECNEYGKEMKEWCLEFKVDKDHIINKMKEEHLYEYALGKQFYQRNQEHGALTRHEWCRNNWGVTNGGYWAMHFENTGYFDSNWVPPVAWVLELSIQKQVRVHHVFYEPGCDCIGEAFYKDGTYEIWYYECKERRYHEIRHLFED